MPTNTIPQRYYPALTNLLSADQLPDSLGFLKDGIAALLSKVRYKDLQFNISAKGDAAFYGLSIIARDRLDIEIPGTGVFLVLNPDAEDVAISAFPITLDWQWKILGYLRGFDPSDFTGTPQQLFQLLLRILDLSEEQALAHFINTFAEPADSNTSPLQQFVQDIQNNEGLTLTAPDNRTFLSVIAKEIFQQTGGISASLIAFSTYILNNDLTITKEKLGLFFRRFIPGDPETFIQDYILPKAEASIKLSAAIEFPRSMLLPLDEQSLEPIPESATIPGYPRTQFQFEENIFQVSTEEGFTGDLDLILQSSHPAMIGNTGLIINFQNIIIDLFDQRNIAQANEEGRALAFKGIFAEEVSIILPKALKTDTGENVTILGKEFLIGSEGGVSGTVLLEQGPLQLNLGGLGFRLDELEFKFYQDTIKDSIISGAFQIPGLQSTNGGDAITFTLLFKESGIHEVDATIHGVFEALGLPVALQSFSFTFDQNGIIAFNTDGTLTLPGLGTSGGSLVIDFTLSIADNNYRINAAAQNDLNFFGLPMNLEAIEIAFDQNGLNDFSVDGGFTVPGIKNDQNDAASFEFSLDIEPNNYVLNIKQKSGDLNLLGMEIGFDQLQIQVTNTGLSTLTLSGSLGIPGLEDDNENTKYLDFELDIAPADYRLRIEAVGQGLNLFDMPLTLAAGEVAFDDQGLETFVLSGSLELSNDLGGGTAAITLTIDKDGIHVELDNQQTGVRELTIPSPILTPVPPETVSESVLQYKVKSISLSTSNGVGINEASFEGLTKSEVLNTGLILHIPNDATVEIDLSEDKNITAADDENRPINFKGASFSKVEFELPTNWNKSSTSTGKIIAEDVLFGNVDGFSGQLSLSGTELKLEFTPDVILTFDTFNILFEKDQILSSNLSATLELTGLDKALDVTLSLLGDATTSYEYTASLSGTPAIKFADDFSITNLFVEFKFKNTGVTKLSLTGQLNLPDALGGIVADLSFNINNNGDLAIHLVNTNPSQISSLPIPAPLLTPVDPGIQNSEIKYSITGLSYVTGQGIAITGTSFISFTKSEVLNTGLILDVTNAKLDLDENSNLTEIYDNRSDNFKGVWIEKATIDFPNWWKKESTPTAQLVGKELIIGNEGGFTGTLSLEPINGGEQKLVTNLTSTTALTLEKFEVVFEKDNLESSLIEALLKVPVFDDAIAVTMEITKEQSTGYYDYAITSEDFPLMTFGNMQVDISDIDLLFNRSGLKHLKIYGDLIFDSNAGTIGVVIEIIGDDFYIKGSRVPGITLDFFTILQMTINSIGFGRNQGKWFLELDAAAELLVNIPLMNKIVPQKIGLHPLLIGKPLYSEVVADKTQLELEWADGYKVGPESTYISIPVNKKVLGFLLINEIGIEIDTPDDESIRSAFTIDGGLQIGPVTGIIEGLGLELTAKVKPNKDGNLGLLDLVPNFSPPTGISISIDAEGFSGGGYLSIDNGRYRGIVNLNFKDKLSFTAIGILTTASGDSGDGFSLLLLITVENLSVQLGMGFMLTGVGGLLALNRTMNIDALRQGVKSGALNSLMFPQDPLANFNVIINDLETFFPYQEKHFVFGPMVKIAWGGAKALLEIELGLIIEIPAPARIAMPGVLRTLIPKKDSKVLSLQVNFLGAIDFGEKSISFDATLFDSRLMQFTLSGDMAFRLNWGDQPNFVFSIGGFHPAFKPPPLGLPKMDRLRISLLDTSKGKVHLSTYFAITSNTVQLGAKLEANFKAAKWRAVGMIYFDALFQFNPFHFIINAGAMFAVINKRGKELLAVSLDMMLSGPTPWKVKGTARFKLLGIKARVRFNKTFGDRKNTVLPDVEVWPLLKKELQSEDSWQAVFPVEKNDLVKIKKVDAKDDLIVHPVGSFIISQQLVPLDETLEKFGNQKTKGLRNFKITKVEIVQTGSQKASLALSAVKNHFAIGQFKNLSDARKLNAPSFQQFKSGVRLKGTEGFQLGKGTKRVIKYELILKNESEDNTQGEMIRANGSNLSRPLITESVDRFRSFVKSSATGQSGLSAKYKGKNVFPEKQINLEEEELYYIVEKENLNKTYTQAFSYTEAVEELKRHEDKYPAQEGKHQVIPEFELLS